MNRKPLLRSAVTATLLCFAALGGAAGCRGKSTTATVPAEEARRLLLDRNWLDRLPQTPQDRLHVFRFVPAMGGGVYQDRTLFAGSFELFTFDHDGETLHFHLHHTGEEHTAGYTIERLPVGNDNPLELHLHINDTPRGPADYYSIRGMQVAASETDLEQSLQKLWPQTPSK